MVEICQKYGLNLRLQLDASRVKEYIISVLTFELCNFSFVPRISLKPARRASNGARGALSSKLFRNQTLTHCQTGTGNIPWI